MNTKDQSTATQHTHGSGIGADLSGRDCFVTGAAQGIGLALCRELRRRGVGKIIMLDRQSERLEVEAREIDGVPIVVDLADSEALNQCLKSVASKYPGISLLFSNAGVLIEDTEADAGGSPDAVWQTCWDINMMAHVRIARALLPTLLASGGWIVLTASAAGLLAFPGSATYSVTKHAVVAYADYLSIRYGDAGLGVSVLCPQAVATDMITPWPDGGIAGLDGIVSADAVARLTLAAVAAGDYLILPHTQVSDYAVRRAQDHGRWLGAMRKTVAKLSGRGRES